MTEKTDATNRVACASRSTRRRVKQKRDRIVLTRSRTKSIQRRFTKGMKAERPALPGASAAG
jgi:hypothetical protein